MRWTILKCSFPQEANWWIFNHIIYLNSFAFCNEIVLQWREWASAWGQCLGCLQCTSGDKYGNWLECTAQAAAVRCSHKHWASQLLRMDKEQDCSWVHSGIKFKDDLPKVGKPGMELQRPVLLPCHTQSSADSFDFWGFCPSLQDVACTNCST